MKRLIAGLGAGIALAIPAVVAAATPTSGQTYMEQARSAHLVAIGTYSSRGLSESRNSGPYLSGPGPNVGKRNNRYQWIIGDKPYQRPIRVTSAGYWSATRVNQASLNPGRSPKVTVTAHFSSATGGVGTWQVHGCAKHHFAFRIVQGAPGSA